MIPADPGDVWSWTSAEAVTATHREERRRRYVALRRKGLVPVLLALLAL